MSLNQIFQKQVLRGLSPWQEGQLTVILPDDSRQHFGDPERGARDILHIHHPRTFQRVALGLERGFGEAFMDGDWSSPNLVSLIRSYIRNAPYLKLHSHMQLPKRLAMHAFQWLHRNSRRGSKENILYHYDLGNEFYELFLDETMTYSSARFDKPGVPLEEAQRAKFDDVCTKLRLTADDHLLEIGCGWGGLAIHAATHYGCRVTGITISQEQFREATRRVRDAGLAHRVEIQLCDYRDVEGCFDKIVSIEMFEAVGQEYWGSYLRHLDRVLKPKGLALIHTIAVPDQHFNVYRRDPGWLQKYIFPGGFLPSLERFFQVLRKETTLEIHALEEHCADYAETLKQWRERFWKKELEVRALGFDDRFLRMWNYYLALCEAAFSEHENRLLQIQLTRPNNPAHFPERVYASDFA